MIKKISFVMYAVKDLFRARRFYEITLGLSVKGSEANGEWVEYALPEGGNFAITTLAQNTIPADEKSCSVAFEVEDLEQFVNQLKNKDVSFKKDIYTARFYKIAIIEDPDGNSIMLRQTMSDD